MLALFDIDGTVIDTQAAEGECYARALLEVTGLSLPTLDWTKYVDATSSGIFREIVRGRNELGTLESRFKNRFLELLHEVRPHRPQDFRPVSGSVEFLERLKRDEGCKVAFATGGFDTEARFKLACCGIELDDYPHATSSDCCSRTEIMRLAIKRAGEEPAAAVYFGDGLWDVTASEALSIPMIGIGRKVDRLVALTEWRRFRDYSDPDGIVRAMNRIFSLASASDDST